jgi:FAD binding domain
VNSLNSRSLSAQNRQETDVVVLGTGAAGLTAAIAAHDSGASVAIYEKADVIGGTSALSGGVCWLPCNPVAAAAGAIDSREDALAYLQSLSHGLIVYELAAAFVDGAPQLVDYLQSRTSLRFRVLAIPDYHPEHPGGRPKGGRSLEPTLTAFDELGEWATKVGWGEMSDPTTGDVYLMTSEGARGGGKWAHRRGGTCEAARPPRQRPRARSDRRAAQGMH